MKRFGIAAIAAAVMVMTGLGHPGIAAAGENGMDAFGSKQRLTDAAGAVVQDWTVTDLKTSADLAPGYPLAGQLWEATATVEAISGTVTPMIPNFHASSADGRSYPALWQLASPQGISGATIAQGQRSTGKLYFDVTGGKPAMVTYMGGMQSLMWCGCADMMPMPMGDRMQ